MNSTLALAESQSMFRLLLLVIGYGQRNVLLCVKVNAGKFIHNLLVNLYYLLRLLLYSVHQTKRDYYHCLKTKLKIECETLTSN